MASAERVDEERPTDEAREQERKSAIDFVDILFALVVGSALDAITRSGHMSAAGRSHLALAGFLTIGSWIGYHNSEHRYAGRIRFDLRRPDELTALGKFSVDVGLVVVYWLAVRTTEGGFERSARHPSWHAAVLLTLVSFVGYAIWDLFAWLTPRTGARGRGPYWKPRRAATLKVLVVVLVLGGSVWLADPSGSGSITVVNSVLCLLVVGYRFLKDMGPATRGDSQGSLSQRP